MKAYNKIMTIAAFAAVLSLPMGFIPVATAQSTQLTVTLGANCGLSFDNANQGQSVTPPTSAVFSLDLSNNGNAGIPISANAGDSTQAGAPVGGFASAPRTGIVDVHIPPNQITVDGNDGVQAGINAVIPTVLVNAGTDILVANLAPTGPGGENDPRTMTMTAATNAMSNLPVTGAIVADFTLTGNTGACFT